MSETQALHRSFLSFRDGLYAKLAGGLALIVVALYWLDNPDGPPNGGTWLGYTLGTAGLGLIVWLAWFGIRRRRYGRPGSMENLLSAHVYFGLALIVVATLHTGFQFHWNVHTFAYGLMVLVIGSGIFGAYAFRRYPPLMTANRSGANLSAMTSELASLDLRCQELALNFPDAITALVAQATVRPRGAKPPDSRATLAAFQAVEQQLNKLEGASPADVLGLVQALTRRVALLDTLNRDRRYRALMLLWRAVHVPLTIGLLAALFIHVFAVFYNW